jgi:hypothetical protein
VLAALGLSLHRRSHHRLRVLQRLSVPDSSRTRAGQNGLSALRDRPIERPSHRKGAAEMAGLIVLGIVMLIWVLAWDASDERSA